MRPIKLAVAAVVTFLVASAITGERACLAQMPTVRSSEIHGRGGWRTDGKAGRTTQRWNLDVVRGADNSIRGRVTVADSPLFTAGNVEGKIAARRVFGTISDDHGNHIVAFDGRITSNGFRGRYVDRTGEKGEWSWEGPLSKENGDLWAGGD